MGEVFSKCASLAATLLFYFGIRKKPLVFVSGLVPPQKRATIDEDEDENAFSFMEETSAHAAGEDEHGHREDNRRPTKTTKSEASAAASSSSSSSSSFVSTSTSKDKATHEMPQFHYVSQEHADIDAIRRGSYERGDDDEENEKHAEEVGSELSKSAHAAGEDEHQHQEDNGWPNEMRSQEASPVSSWSSPSSSFVSTSASKDQEQDKTTQEIRESHGHADIEAIRRGTEEGEEMEEEEVGLEPENTARVAVEDENRHQEDQRRPTKTKSREALSPSSS
ncbi:unnamed protein product [Amoebophrya sp. A25]|nr:unnamed protein product [Amoebophrya sp. A25]|eukprot:GSA25T00003031001.1